jgi:GxxExxY protein
MLLYEELSGNIRGAAIEVHRELGPGLLEPAYEQCLCHEFGLRGLSFRRQVPLPVAYKGIKLDCGYRLDAVVEDLVVLELKSVAQCTELNKAQLLTYLRLSGKKLGVLINFNVSVMKDGITRLLL